jgi:hypothetical protein
MKYIYRWREGALSYRLFLLKSVPYALKILSYSIEEVEGMRSDEKLGQPSLYAIPASVDL